MPCNCKKRAKAWLAEKKAKKAAGKHGQAAVIGVALAAAQLVGKLIGEQDNGTEGNEEAAPSPDSGK